MFSPPRPTEIYTLSLHDALPILRPSSSALMLRSCISSGAITPLEERKNWLRMASAIITTSIKWSDRDRKSTRLNSSHGYISYAVFCLKKKTQRPLHNLFVHGYTY